MKQHPKIYNTASVSSFWRLNLVQCKGSLNRSLGSYTFEDLFSSAPQETKRDREGDSEYEKQKKCLEKRRSSDMSPKSSAAAKRGEE